MSTIVKSDANGAVVLPAEFCRAAGVMPDTDLLAEIQDGRIVIEQSRVPFWERIAARAAKTPQEEIDKLPADGSAQIDHYLYGHPKR
jgi:antitoxin component of MazEF toxin-antitoxin module